MNVVVVGRNYSSLLGMIRASGMAGYPVTVVRIVRKVTSKKESDRFSVIRSSKYVEEQYFAEQDRNALLNVLLTKCAKEGEKQVILPTDDFAASTIDLNYDQLIDFFYLPNIHHSQGKVVFMMDKRLQKEIAEKVGLNVAKGWVVDVKDGKYTIPEGIEYPVFTKPEISIQLNKNCMKRSNNQAELDAVLKDVAEQADCKILVEQFVEIEKEYGILGASDGENAIIPGIVTKESIGHGAHNGVTLVGTYSSLSPYGDLKEKLIRFIKEIQFTGLFDIDLYESKGTVFFNELNLRLGAFGFAAVRAGYNMPGMIIECLKDGTAIRDSDYCKTIVCINEKVNLEDYAAGFISWEKYKNNMNTADFGFIKDKDDPKPYRAFSSFVMKARLKSILKFSAKR